MREYDRDEYEDYEGYDDEGYEQEEYEDGEDQEYEEVEARKPSKEELGYLELRQKLKESFRKKLKRESGSAHSNSQEKKKKLPSDNYGSFFGPSQPVIAQRVIQETKSLLENQHLASKTDSHKMKSNASTATGSKIVHDRPPKINEVQRQHQKRRETRDYSFLLSDDATLPAPANPPRSLSVPYSDTRPAQASLKNRQPPGNGARIYAHSGGQERKSVPSSSTLNSKTVPRKSASASQPNLSSMVSRKQLGSNNGVGPGRPKPLPSKVHSSVPERRPPVSMERRASAPMEKKRPSVPMEKRPSVPMQRRAGPPVERRLSAPIEKRPIASTVKRPSGGPMERRPSAPLKNVQPASHRPPPSKMQTSLSKQHLEPRKGLTDPNRGRLMQKPPLVSSKPQMSKPARPISSNSMSRDNRPKKRPSRPFSDDEDEDVMALNMIRKMFNTSRYADTPDDDSDMEAGFDEIMAEEKRSAKIARKEDEEQLRLIEEEEQRERMRKKRKLSQH